MLNAPLVWNAIRWDWDFTFDVVGIDAGECRAGFSWLKFCNQRCDCVNDVLLGLSAVFGKSLRDSFFTNMDLIAWRLYSPNDYGGNGDADNNRSSYCFNGVGI